MSERDVLRVSGPDAVTFLQGQLSQDVAGLPPGQNAPSFLLSPQGRVDAWLDVRRTADDTVELAVRAGWGDAVEARLRRFLLRTKAQIERVADTAMGPDSSETDEVERVIAGVPAMGAEIDERTIPAETGWVEASVSFTKGCFVGQELVARMDSRTAAPPRRLVRLLVAAPTEVEVPKGESIEVAGTTVGELTSVAWSPARSGHVALGYVKRGTDVPGPASIAGHAATIEGFAGA